jgi:hypothetical protein
MKKIIPLLFLFYFSITAAAQVNPQDSAWIRDNYTKKEVYITMRDGVKLFTCHLSSERRLRKTSDLNDPYSLFLLSLR